MRHILGHSLAQQAGWPGGMVGLLRRFLDSVNTWMGEAQGYPEVLLHLASRCV